MEASGSSDRWVDLEEEVDGLLEKVIYHDLSLCVTLLRCLQLRETNDQLSELLNSPDSPLSQSMARTIQRHREILSDYERDSARTKASIPRQRFVEAN